MYTSRTLCATIKQKLDEKFENQHKNEQFTKGCISRTTRQYVNTSAI